MANLLKNSYKKKHWTRSVPSFSNSFNLSPSLVPSSSGWIWLAVAVLLLARVASTVGEVLLLVWFAGADGTVLLLVTRSAGSMSDERSFRFRLRGRESNWGRSCLVIRKVKLFWCWTHKKYLVSKRKVRKKKKNQIYKKLTVGQICYRKITVCRTSTEGQGKAYCTMYIYVNERQKKKDRLNRK